MLVAARMHRISLRVVFAGVVFLLLFAAIAPSAQGAAAAAAAAPARVAASVDRIEDDWIVLDASPRGALSLPRAMAPWAREADAVVVLVMRAHRYRDPERVDELRSAWRARVLDVPRDSPAPSLLLASGDEGETRFRWPVDLAPARVRRGDWLEFQVEPDADRARNSREELDRLRAALLDS